MSMFELAVIKSKDNEGFVSLVNRDTRFSNVKLFDKAIMTPVAISESGYIGIYQFAHSRQAKTESLLQVLVPKYESVPETLTVIHISEVIGFDLTVDNTSGLGGAILGGLIAGGAGAIVGQAISSSKPKVVDLQIKTKNFNNPQIIVPLYRPESSSRSPLLGGITKSLINSATGKAKLREEEIQELLSQLDNISACASIKK